MRVSTWSRAQSSLMSHSGLSWLASMAGLTSEGNGLAKGACCFREKFFFWSFPSLRTFNMLAFSKRERGGITDSPWPFFFFLAAAASKNIILKKKKIYLRFLLHKIYIYHRIALKYPLKCYSDSVIEKILVSPEGSVFSRLCSLRM